MINVSKDFYKGVPAIGFNELTQNYKDCCVILTMANYYEARSYAEESIYLAIEATAPSCISPQLLLKYT